MAYSGGLGSGMSQYRYENENFFETERDEWIKISNIFERKQFWERINSFFKVTISSEMIDDLRSFY